MIMSAMPEIMLEALRDFEKHNIIPFLIRKNTMILTMISNMTCMIVVVLLSNSTPPS